MSDDSSLLGSFVRRGIFAGGAIAAGWFLMADASAQSDIVQVTIGIGCVLAGAILIANPIARLLAEPFGGLIFPTAHFEKPLPQYSIPESHKKNGRYREAFDGFMAISRKYPQELKAYVEMLDVAVLGLKDDALAARVLELGMSMLKKEGDRAALNMMHSGMRSMRDSPRRHEPPKVPFHPHAEG